MGMFDNRKDKEKIRKDMAALSQPLSPQSVIAQPVEKSLLDQLKSTRKSKIEKVIKLNDEIIVLDAEITYLESHPGAENIMRHFLINHPKDGDVEER